ncbi:MAG TPA: hypothetical protein VGM88_24515 [Kofleriaceae bacterium]
MTRSWWLLLLAAACGGGGGAADGQRAPDGAIDAADDAAVDAPPDPLCTPTGAEPGDVQVLLPAVDPTDRLVVIASDRSGTMLTRLEATGSTTATVTVPSCGMVTVWSGAYAGAPNLLTWTGVQPGDVLHDPRAHLTVIDTPVAVQLPDAGVNQAYYVALACDGGYVTNQATQSSGVFPTDAECSPSAPTLYASVAAVSLTDLNGPAQLATASATIQGITTSITLPALAPPPSTFDLSLTDISDYNNLWIYTSTLPAPGIVLPYRTLYLAIPGSTLDVPAVAAPAGPMVLRLSSIDDQNGVGLIRGYEAAPASVALSATQDLLPTLPSISTGVVKEHRYLTPAISLTPIAGSLMVGEIAVHEPGDTLYWTIVAPPEGATTTLRYPALPPDLLYVAPEDTEVDYEFAGVYAIGDTPDYATDRGRLDLVDAPPTATSSVRSTTRTPIIERRHRAGLPVPWRR